MNRNLDSCNCGSKAKLKFVVNGYSDSLKYWVCEICKKEANTNSDNEFNATLRVRVTKNHLPSHCSGTKVVLNYDQGQVELLDEKDSKPPIDTL